MGPINPTDLASSKDLESLKIFTSSSLLNNKKLLQHYLLIL